MYARRKTLATLISVLVASASAVSVAATCPFDNGGSDAINDGLVLTRYALEITGSALVANTRYASLDPVQVKNNIECVSCALDMNGDQRIDTVDTTIIARHLAGFTGNALTNGLALGSGSRPDTASIASFLANGCGITGGTVTSVATGAGLLGGPITTSGTINLAATQLLPTTACANGEIAKWNGSAWGCAADASGPANAWVQGGNALGAPGVIGTTDAQNLSVQSGGTQVSVLVPGGNGLRVVQTTGLQTNAPNLINGSAANVIAQFDDGNPNVATQGATVGGGGHDGLCIDPPTGTLTRNCGNEARSRHATVSGGLANRASGQTSAVGGGAYNTASGYNSTVGGGSSNTASGTASTVGGGSGNTASGVDGSTVGGGVGNVASGTASTVAGGRENVAEGTYSFAAGSRARAANNGAFVWADGQSFTFSSTVNNSFNIRANGGVRLSTDTSMFFGSQVRQMLNLLGPNNEYGIGVQNGALYLRSGANFAWYTNGVHSDTPYAPGAGGTRLATLSSAANTETVSGTLRVQAVQQTSDRNAKSAFQSISARNVLAKLASLPIKSWSYNNELANNIRHIGPVAQDFKKAFGVGHDDTTISVVDAQGVALAAIQGLHQIVKEKDAEIVALKSRLAAIEWKLGVR
jgi:trimeric autotransporter adhesin